MRSEWSLWQSRTVASGKLILYCGPMFSGKTERLLSRTREAEANSERVILAKPAADSRHPGRVVSHSGAEHMAIEVATADALVAAALDVSVICIDEVQFLRSEITRVLRQLADSGREVNAAGLDLDFRGQPFPTVQALHASADTTNVLTAVCTRCGDVATRTQRFANGLPAPLDDPILVIGGSELYQARCERCFFAERRP
jgi:thymidine kinase